MRITVKVTLDEEFDVDPESFWDDKDRPDVIDAHEVAQAIQRRGGAVDALGLWPEVRIEVRRENPHYTQAEALFPDLAPTPEIRSLEWTT